MKFFLCLLLLFPLTLLRADSESGEVRMLKKELARKEQELERLTALLTQKERELRKVRLWMSNLSADSRLTTVSDREERLLHGLQILSDASGAMVLKTMELADRLRPRLDQLPLSSTSRVRLVMALEDLERAAAKVNTLTDTVTAKEEQLFRDVRILGVRPELNMAVLSVGAVHGVFPGMTFVTADGQTALRVLETRPMISGAVPVAGSLKNLVTGTRLNLQITKTPAAKKEKKK